MSRGSEENEDEPRRNGHLGEVRENGRSRQTHERHDRIDEAVDFTDEDVGRLRTGGDLLEEVFVVL